MSYLRPPYNQADATWQLQAPHTYPAHNAADAQWEPEDATFISATGRLDLRGSAAAWYKTDISATGVLEVAGSAELVERTGASATGRLGITGAARGTLLAYIESTGRLSVAGVASTVWVRPLAASGQIPLLTSGYYAPSWYVPTPFIGGRNGHRAAWGDLPRHDHLLTAPHQESEIVETSGSIPWGDLEKLDPRTLSGWLGIPPLETDLGLAYADLTDHQDAKKDMGYAHPDSKERNDFQFPWGDAIEPADAQTDIGYAHPRPAQRDRIHIPWDDSMAPYDIGLDLGYSHPAVKDVDIPIISGPYYYPRWCIRQYVAPKGDELIFEFFTVPAYTAPAGDSIVFNDETSRYPEFCYDGTWNGPKDGYWYQPHPWDLVSPNIRRVYIVMNTVTLERLSDGVPIPVEDLTIGTDMDSWAWTLRAALVRKSDLDLVRPQAGAPVEVEADINGLTWRFVIEEYGEESRWAQRAYTITGRSLSAYLADPYSAPRDRVEATQATAQQLAEAELTDTGFSVAWSLPTWLVPGNVWSYQGQAPIQAIAQIAQAAGGVIHTATASLTLQIKPWYSALPWEWGGVAVDAILPGAMIDSRRASYQPKSAYNGVYVRGQQTGVMCLVKRIGSDGSALAPMQTHPLITATEAGLALARKILADSGPRETVTLTLPLLDNHGLLVPGHLIEIQATGDTWRGQVVKCSITARRPAVQQTIDVIRYHGS